MKLTLVGDPHTKHDNLAKTEELFDMVEKLGNPVIVLGDTLDTKEIIRGKCLNLWYTHLRQTQLHWFFLVGNHCWFNFECKDHSLRTLDSLENVNVIDGLTTLVFGTKKFLFMPYYSDLEAFNKDLIDADVAIIHQGITGFDYGNGYMAVDELPLQSLKDYPLVISGHFHKRQIKDNLVYLGTPFSHSFGESNQEKFIAVLDTETMKLEYIKTPFPNHITLELDMDSDDWKSNFDQLLTCGDNYYRVILKGKSQNMELLDKTQYPNIKFIEESDDQKVNLLISESESNEAQFTKWAKEVKQLDDETIKLGLEILKDEL